MTLLIMVAANLIGEDATYCYTNNKLTASIILSAEL